MKITVKPSNEDALLCLNYSVNYIHKQCPIKKYGTVFFAIFGVLIAFGSLHYGMPIYILLALSISFLVANKIYQSLFRKQIANAIILPEQVEYEIFGDHLYSKTSLSESRISYKDICSIEEYGNNIMLTLNNISVISIPTNDENVEFIETLKTKISAAT